MNVSFVIFYKFIIEIVTFLNFYTELSIHKDELYF